MTDETHESGNTDWQQWREDREADIARIKQLPDPTPHQEHKLRLLEE